MAVRATRLFASALLTLMAGPTLLSATEPPIPARKPPLPAPQSLNPTIPEALEKTPEPAVPAAAKAGLEISPAMACEARLTDLAVTFEVMAPIDDDGPCDIPRPLRVTALAPGVAFVPEGALNCETVESLARWTRHVLIPAAETHLQATPSAVRHGSTYVCRGRSGSGKPSEHAIGNAVDIISLEFADRTALPIQSRPEDGGAEGAFQKRLRHGACAYFTTVLGPGTDAAHADHFHFDRRQRKRGYRICQ